jgi:hypothetical protein
MQSFSSLMAANKRQLEQRPTMSAADAMRQTTMTQCYNPGVGAGVAAVGTASPVPVLPAHISSVPPGYHYYEMSGMAYFLNLSSGEKVELGPVKSSRSTPIDLEASFGGSSFVTPCVKKAPRMITKRKKAPMVLSEFNGDNEEVVYVPRRTKKIQRVETEQIQHQDAVEEDESEVEVVLEVESDDLPRTSNFAGSAARRSNQEEDDESDEEETVVDGSQSPNLLEEAANDKDTEGEDDGIV